MGGGHAKGLEGGLGAGRGVGGHALGDAAGLDAARCLCGIINDPSHSLRKEVISLYSLKSRHKEVQRCVILRLSGTQFCLLYWYKSTIADAATENQAGKKQAAEAEASVFVLLYQ